MNIFVFLTCVFLTSTMLILIMHNLINYIKSQNNLISSPGIDSDVSFGPSSSDINV